MLRSTLRSTQFRLAAMVLFAAVAISLTAASARAFNQQNGGTGQGGNAAFADPDEQVNNMFGFGEANEPSALSGAGQFGPQHGDPFKHFQTDSLTSPPDPLSRPSN